MRTVSKCNVFCKNHGMNTLLLETVNSFHVSSLVLASLKNANEKNLEIVKVQYQFLFQQLWFSVSSFNLPWSWRTCSRMEISRLRDASSLQKYHSKVLYFNLWNPEKKFTPNNLPVWVPLFDINVGTEKGTYSSYHYLSAALAGGALWLSLPTRRFLFGRWRKLPGCALCQEPRHIRGEIIGSKVGIWYPKIREQRELLKIHHRRRKVNLPVIFQWERMWRTSPLFFWVLCWGM